MTMRVLTAITVAFIFIFIFGWVWHGILLAEHYAALPGVFRPQGEMRDYFAWLFGGQLLVAVALVLLLNQHNERLSAGLGLRFGLLMGLLSAGSQIISYSSLSPVSMELLIWWVTGSFVQMPIMGALLADILKGE